MARSKSRARHATKSWPDHDVIEVIAQLDTYLERSIAQTFTAMSPGDIRRAIENILETLKASMNDRMSTRDIERLLLHVYSKGKPEGAKYAKQNLQHVFLKGSESLKITAELTGRIQKRKIEIDLCTPLQPRSARRVAESSLKAKQKTDNQQRRSKCTPGRSLPSRITSPSKVSFILM